MYKCLFCGLDNTSERARFCVECGPDGPAKDWASEEIDQPQKVSQYVSILSEFYFDAPNISSVDKFSLRIRERLKISHDTHSTVLSKLNKQKQAIAHLANFRFEFNENVIDAYAGHDTFLNFRYTNLSEDDLFKVSLFWDDPDTLERIDLKAETKSSVKPLTSVTIGASAIFDRIGIKELSDFQITITDQFGESAKFRVEPFSFRVGNHDQKITQNISTHNQISIEGRGVIDASGMGADKSGSETQSNSQPRWKELHFTYLTEEITNFSPASIPNPEPEVQHNLESTAAARSTVINFDKDNLLSVLKAAEQGDAEAQKTLGNMYRDGQGVVKNDEQAVHWFRLAAEQNNAPGQNNLGMMYENGLGVAKNDEQAVNWYRKAAEQGLAAGQHNLGSMYENGEGVAQNIEKAFNWYRMAAEQGLAISQLNLGTMYENGNGISKNDEKAVDWYRKAAEQDFADGQIKLACMYESGKGVPKNDEQALHWIRKAAEQGHADGQNKLGYMYQHGKGVATNYDQAVNWYRKSAEQDYAVAQNNLGLMYQHGNGVAKNYDLAVHWFQKAAEQDYPDAQDNLGLMYQNGEGVAKNDEQAVYWFRKAAEQGYAFGQSNLGIMYEFGQGVPVNNEQAVHWYLKAAEQDAPFGQYCIGEMYEKGKGVVQSNEQAVYWYRKAAEQGNEAAIESLKKLESHEVASQAPTDGHGSWDYGNYTYTGMFKNGQWNGLGELTWSGDDLGHRYVGNFVNGLRHGQGTYTFPNGTNQVGIFQNNVYQQPDTDIEDDDEDDEADLTWDDGSSYSGEVENGQPNGFGTYTFANGDSMYGIFVNGKMNDDTAHYDFADGGTYDGPMVNGNFSGFGTRIFGGEYEGHSYTGNFVNGYFHGEGTYVFPNGATNVGQFKDGTFVPPSPSVTDYDYFGATSNGVPHGVGKMTFKNGEIYKGDFVNGMRHGLGELTYANGSQVMGRFENNEFVKKASFTESVKIGFKTGSL